MADYVAILDTQIEPDAPLTAVLAGQWRDNPIAIAGGAPGAPRVDLPAIVDALAGVAAGSLGSYVWARDGDNNVGFGATRAGSNLNPTGALWGTHVVASATTGAALAGTWRCMGFHSADRQDPGDPNRFARFATLWLRIS